MEAAIYMFVRAYRAYRNGKENGSSSIYGCINICFLKNISGLGLVLLELDTRKESPMVLTNHSPQTMGKHFAAFLNPKS